MMNHGCVGISRGRSGHHSGELRPSRRPQGPRRRPAQGRSPRPTTRIRRAALSDHRPGRPARSPSRAGQPTRLRRPRAAGPVPVQPPPESGRPPPGRRPTRPRRGGRPLRPGAARPGRQPCRPSRRRRAGRARPRPRAGELLLAFERDLEPRLAAGSGDLAHLAGWAAKLAGATCRLAGLLHLASHLRDGWARPITADSFAGAVRLAGYLVEHARAVFDLMGADPRIDDARWLLDWISRTDQAQFSRRDAHQSSPAAGSARPPTWSQPWPCWRSTAGCAASTPTARAQGRPAALPAVPRQPLAPRLRTYRTLKTSLADRF